MANTNSTTDYRKFKTPFYKITICNPQRTKSVDLPHQLLRLVQKVEIQELSNNEAKDGEYNWVIVTFVEGSREPAKTSSSANYSGNYTIDSSIGGILTNRTGVLTDLKFSGKNGITSQTTTNSIIDTSTTDSSSLTGPITPSDSEYLFQHNNIVILTWGYLEDKANARSVCSTIAIIESNFPHDAQPTVTIRCTVERDLDQLAPINSKNLGSPLNVAQNKFVTEFTDTEIAVIINNFAKELGADAYVSTSFPVDILPTTIVKTIPGNQSFLDWFREAAKTHHAELRFALNPNTNRYAIYFIYRGDFEAKTIAPDSLLIYKNPGSILRKVDVKVDYTSASASAVGAVDSTSPTPQINSTDASINLFTPIDNSNNATANTNISSSANQQRVDNQPTSNKFFPGCEKIFGPNNVTCTSISSPRSENLDYSTNATQVAEAQLSRKIVMIEGETLGYPNLFPGMINIGNIGNRYSGKYKIIKSTHTIDSNGYYTTFQAVSPFLSDGGSIFPINGAPAVVQSSDHQIALVDPTLTDMYIKNMKASAPSTGTGQ